MRGEQQQQELMIRAGHPITAMRAINREGEVQHYIVTTWWFRGTLIIIALMLVAIMGLLGLFIYNNNKLHQLEIKVEEVNTNSSP